MKISVLPRSTTIGRCGKDFEVVLCEGKTTEQVVAIARALIKGAHSSPPVRKQRSPEQYADSIVERGTIRTHVWSQSIRHGRRRKARFWW